MIKINVDEAYAFDYYSILDLKFKNGYITQEILMNTKIDLINQVGEELFDRIKNSIEYEKLLEANKITFEAVNKAKTDDVLASYVDKCNYSRMLAKKSLQEKFFTTTLTETKIGYEKLKING
jgi:hypothetical protein